MSKKFKVVKIVDEYNIVINAGSTDGITKKTNLEIYVPGEQVIDPDTSEFLGTLDTIKAYLKVTDIFPKMCVCENAETRTPANILVSSAFNETKPLNIDSTQISGRANNVDRKIRIGDLVRISPS